MRRARIFLLCGSLLFSGIAARAGMLQPAWVLELPPSVPGIFVADASTATLHRFENANGVPRWSNAYYMSIGKNGVRKERAWDRKSPLGTYYLTEELDTTPLHDKYGIAAFPLDYPNTWDRLNQRTGYGIWLHGVDHREPYRPPLDTDGCLALPNSALGLIAPQLRPLETPIVVADGLKWLDGDTVRDLRNGLAAALEAWRVAQVEGDLLDYLALYAADFVIDGMDIAEWSAYKLQVFQTSRPQVLEIEDLYLLGEAGAPGVFLSRFSLKATRGERSYSLVKRIYWRRLDNGRWKIVAEGTG
jgi:ketosteroid isomerase-like protein